MTRIIEFVVNYWHVILEYILMFVAYFLVYLYKNKSTNTRDNLIQRYKEQTSQLTNTERRLEQNFAEQLRESKTAYQAAVDEICSLKDKVLQLEQALNILLETEETMNE